MNCKYFIQKFEKNIYFTIFSTEIISFNLKTLRIMSYYRVIDGKKYDNGLLAAAEEAVKGRGDGRISLDDAKLLLEQVKDGDTYTDIEKDTMEYIRNNFKWTEEADEWFRTEIRKWAATK
ncbi:hypothetical protein AD998_05960 [bacterium 336/3]|jgi:hypothetical protein|nr:hypothetical protein AD998_05960 [bacterium 336/3]